jgi:hypothetical protein
LAPRQGLDLAHNGGDPGFRADSEEFPVVRVTGAALVAVLVLGGCQQAGSAAGEGGDKYAGLDVAIKSWHASVKETDAMCVNKPEAQACNSFEVACKGERPVDSADQAKGITAKVVAAMSWQAWSAETSEYRPASGVAEFTKVGDEWRRADAAPVNLSTCA